ncbi:MAG: hypothetical protein ABW007_02915 [Chitinophagaceae bacterium]
MKSLLSLLFIVCIIGSISCKTTSAVKKIYSEWSYQNRQTGEYMYEEDGRLKTGKKPSDDRYYWIHEATESNAVRIRNKKTGHYLQMDNNGQPILGEASGASTNSWLFKGFDFGTMTNCSWYTFLLNDSSANKMLYQQNDQVEMGEQDRIKDLSTQWTIVREKGSILPFAITSDSVFDASFLGDRMAWAKSPSEIVSDYHGKNHSWKLQKDISAFPTFTATANPMLAALYQMAMEEMVLNLRPDSTFATGKLWPDTWTRDAVYSIYFSFSWINTKIALNTLRKQTLKDPAEALQDTGTGGSWPISTDRIVWAIAAWEYYLTTGDKNWLKEAYDGLRYTADKDIHVAFDNSIGLFKGEACSMDWRTHTYPNWFSNENIGESFSSGTNALHYFNYSFLEKAGNILNQDKATIEKWKHYKDRIKTALNTHCWNKEKGLYTAYLYPAYMQYAPSDRVDIMSNGLCALLEVASTDQADQILERYPMYPYGGAVLYPSIPDDFAYHNKSVWAVWQTPLMFMAGKRQHQPVASHLMKSLIRQGAMFLTHKENMTYDTGFDENTALNSDRQLWSVAAYASLVYRMLFGMEYTEEGVGFHPTVPAELVNGPISLEHFRYRDCTLTVKITGTGQHIKTLTVNGKPASADYLLPATATGAYTIEIQMEEGKNTAKKWTLVNPGPGKDWSPVEPVLQQNNQQVSWNSVEGESFYIKGPGLNEKQTSPFSLDGKPAGYYSVYAVNKQGFQSDLSKPVLHTGFRQRIEAELAGTLQKNATGFSGTGYVEDLVAKPANQTFELDIPEDGNYAINLRGSNGRGPHDVYCYIRSVELDGKNIGSFILESSGNWNQWTYSNQLRLTGLQKGKHKVRILFNPERKGYDNNMSYAKGDGYRNDAYLDCLEVVKL